MLQVQAFDRLQVAWPSVFCRVSIGAPKILFHLFFNFFWRFREFFHHVRFVTLQKKHLGVRILGDQILFQYRPLLEEGHITYAIIFVLNQERRVFLGGKCGVLRVLFSAFSVYGWSVVRDFVFIILCLIILCWSNHLCTSHKKMHVSIRGLPLSQPLQRRPTGEHWPSTALFSPRPRGSISRKDDRDPRRGEPGCNYKRDRAKESIAVLLPTGERGVCRY